MSVYIMTEGELKLAEIIWEKEPVNSGDLVDICNQKYEWKKSTTYTVLKKLCSQQIVQNIDSMVISLIKREEYLLRKSEKFIADNYSGSLPGFIAAFMKKKKLNQNQINELKKMIDEYEER